MEINEKHRSSKGVQNLEISEAKKKSRGTWQRANFIGVCNVIFEWKGWFAFSSRRKIPISSTPKRNIFTLCDPGKALPEIPSLYLAPCHSRRVVTSPKFQQDSEECLWAWVHQLNKPFFFFFFCLDILTPNNHIQEDWKPWKILWEMFLPTSIWRLKQPRKEGEYWSWRVWNFNQRPGKTLHPPDGLNFIRGCSWILLWHTLPLDTLDQLLC